MRTRRGAGRRSPAPPTSSPLGAPCREVDHAPPEPPALPTLRSVVLLLLDVKSRRTGHRGPGGSGAVAPGRLAPRPAPVGGWGRWRCRLRVQRVTAATPRQFPRGLRAPRRYPCDDEFRAVGLAGVSCLRLGWAGRVPAGPQRRRERVQQRPTVAPRRLRRAPRVAAGGPQRRASCSPRTAPSAKRPSVVHVTYVFGAPTARRTAGARPPPPSSPACAGAPTRWWCTSSKSARRARGTTSPACTRPAGAIGRRPCGPGGATAERTRSQPATDHRAPFMGRRECTIDRTAPKARGHTRMSQVAPGRQARSTTRLVGGPGGSRGSARPHQARPRSAPRRRRARAGKGRPPGGPGGKGRPPTTTGGGGGKGRGPRPTCVTARPPRRFSPSTLAFASIAVVVVIVLVFVVIKVSSGTTSPSKGLVLSLRRPPRRRWCPRSPACPPRHQRGGRGVGRQRGRRGERTSPGALGATASPRCCSSGRSSARSARPSGGRSCEALSRFGTWSGLERPRRRRGTPIPDTATFTFRNATFTSNYLTSCPWSTRPTTTTGRAPATCSNRSPRPQTNLWTQYSSKSGKRPGLPLHRLRQQGVRAGPSYDPQVLAGLTSRRSRPSSTNPTDPVTEGIVGTANYLTASICAADRHQPASVCSAARA